MTSMQLKCQKCGKLSDPIHFDIGELFWRGKPSKKRWMQKMVECAEANGWILVKDKPYCTECVKEVEG